MDLPALEKALKELKEGRPIGLPTETVYGLAASIDSEAALRSVFELKERPLFDPLIIHLSSLSQIASLVSDWPKTADILSKKFWPGPLSLVVPKSRKVHTLITGGLDTVALRMPNHPLALELISQFGTPLAAPSANHFGRTSPTTAEHVRESFPQVYVLDGGPTDVGIESTVLRIFKDRLQILRPGKISKTEIETALKEMGMSLPIEVFSSSHSPGHLENHYQPVVPFFLLNESDSTPTEAIELELPDSPWLAARTLYADLRRLEKNKKPIYLRVKTIHREPAWEALWDRLKKASFKG